MNVEGMTDALRFSRRHLMKHLAALPDDAWDFRPNSACKSIRETLAHLVGGDRATVESLGVPPIEDPMPIDDPAAMMDLLLSDREAVCRALVARYGATPLDAQVEVWGAKQTLACAVAYICSEDYYHAGQIAMLRLSQQPDWDYDAAIYGDG